MNEGDDGHLSEADSLIGLDIAHGYDPQVKLGVSHDRAYKRAKKAKVPVRNSKESLSQSQKDYSMLNDPYRPYSK